MKYYAVYRGIKTGVFTDWNIAKDYVINYKNPIFKAFKSLEDANYFAKNGEEKLKIKSFKTIKLSDLKGITNEKGVMKEKGVMGIMENKKDKIEKKEKIEKIEKKDKIEKIEKKDKIKNMEKNINILNLFLDKELKDEKIEKEPKKITINKIEKEPKKITINKIEKYTDDIIFNDIECKKIDEKSYAVIDRYYDNKYYLHDDTSLFIYTDGSVINNGKPDAFGGYGGFYSDKSIPYFSFKMQGNITVPVSELKAIIYSLEQLKKYDTSKYKEIILFTDSEYSYKSISVWFKGWVKNGWKSKKGEDVKNKELIIKAKELIDLFNVKIEHINSHTDNTSIHHLGNNVADCLSVIYKIKQSKL